MLRFCLSCRIRSPPPPPPLPYTTLFRSAPALKGCVDAGEQALRRCFLVAGGSVDLACEEQAGDLPRLEAARSTEPPATRKQRDRKSTRLNSSHRCISYAVFCLKKKTTTK